MAQINLDTGVTLLELLSRHYPVRDCILSRVGSVGFESLSRVFPTLLEETCVGNDFRFITEAIPEFCFANGTNPLFYELVFPLVCYISAKAPFEELYDMLHHLRSNYTEIGIAARKKCVNIVLRTVRDVARYFLVYSCEEHCRTGCFWEEDLERVKDMSLTYLHDFDPTQLKEEFFGFEMPRHCSRYSKCLQSGTNWWEFKNCCYYLDRDGVDPRYLLQYPADDKGHVCSLEDGSCQKMYKAITRSGKPPVVEFVVLCHLVRYHLRFWLNSVLDGRSGLMDLNDFGHFFHQGLNFVYFVENTNFLALVKKYLLCDILRE